MPKSSSSSSRRYRVFLGVCGVLLLLIAGANAWLWQQQKEYRAEIVRLKAAMTETERERSEFIISSEQDKVRMAFALARHQARLNPRLHLSIAVDSSRMYLERNGAMLREMHIRLAPARVPGSDSADTAAVIRPRGERAIQEVSDSLSQFTLIGGARIYASNDTTTAVTPGDVRVSTADFKAILPNISPGMLVYFY